MTGTDSPKGCVITEVGSGGTFEDNICTGGLFGIALGSMSNVTVRRNIFQGQNAAQASAGVFVDPQTADMSGMSITDNVMVGCSNGIATFNDGGHKTTGALIAHNTIVAPLFRGMSLEAPLDGTVRDNIITGTPSAQMLRISSVAAGGAVAADHNVYHGGISFHYSGTDYASLALYLAGTGKDADAVATDPLLTSRYRPGVGSPALSTGTGGTDKGAAANVFPASWVELANPTAGASRAGEAASHTLAFDAIEALADKIGLGLSTPMHGRILIGMGDGVSAWVPGGGVVTGSKSGNAALTSLLAELVRLGLITDSTT
jgi:parallel beta-helix repeat protein